MLEDLDSIGEGLECISWDIVLSTLFNLFLWLLVEVLLVSVI